MLRLKNCHLWLIVFFLLCSYQVFAKTISLSKKLNEDSYLNLESQNEIVAAIKENDQISIIVENEGSARKEFYFGIKDTATKDYWGQFTFKTNLKRGTNYLNIDLDRNVGERSSQKYQRKIDKEKITKIFIVFNPDKESTDESIVIKEIKFTKRNKIILNSKGKFFLFSDKRTKDYEFADYIDTNLVDLKSNENGFTKLDLWQVRDAKIAPKAWSESIGVKKASLKFNLAKNRYKFILNWNELGYWEPPFWKMRKIVVNGKPKVIETRSSWNDYLEDYFTFYPPNLQNSFEQLKNRIFKPVEFEINHKGGVLTFDIEGDPSGASLNSLWIYPVADRKKAKKDYNNILNYFEEEFNAFYRKLEKDKVDSVAITRENQYSNLVFIEKNAKARLSFRLKNLKGKKIRVEVKDARDLEIHSSVAAYTAQDLNHESYAEGISHFEKNKKRYVSSNDEVWELVFTPTMGQSEIVLAADKIRKKFSYEFIKVLFPEKPIKVGFFGASLVGETYFEGKGKDKWITKNSENSFEILKSEVDFLTDSFSLGFSYNKSNDYFTLSTDPLYSRFFKGKERFVYSATELKSILSGNQRNAAQSKDLYDENLRRALTLLNKDRDYIYLYSDEPTGYRDAVKEDTKRYYELKKQLPGFKLGGFGNLFDEKNKGAKSLYDLWDVGFYADLPSKEYIAKNNKRHKLWGLYNLCAELDADLVTCYGKLLYLLSRDGVKYFLEWHLNSSQNYPYFDLDGREADISFLKTNKKGEVFETPRFKAFKNGIEVYKKLLKLDELEQAGKLDAQSLVWLNNLRKDKYIPIKAYLERTASLEDGNFYTTLDSILRSALKQR